MARKQYSLIAKIYDKRGRLLSQGTNSYLKTHPVQHKHACEVGLPHKMFLHAEIHAIVKCKQLSKAHRIVVERYNQDGTPGDAKPCPVCEHAIKKAGIKVVEHT